MAQRNQTVEDGLRSATSKGHYALQVIGILVFFALAFLMGVEIYQGMTAFGYLWLLPLLAVLAYLGADLASGFVHFLADNFGSPETPVLGPNFIDPFREHHVHPKAITTHDFVVTNGNNSLLCLPVMLAILLFLPIATTLWGHFLGTFILMLGIGVFLTNQFHKWAHMEDPPRFATWLQRRGLILTAEHHDVHHQSPYDTYYCITVGVWNPLLDRTRFFERTERLIRRVVPAKLADPRLRVERDGSLNE